MPLTARKDKKTLTILFYWHYPTSSAVWQGKRRKLSSNLDLFYLLLFFYLSASLPHWLLLCACCTNRFPQMLPVSVSIDDIILGFGALDNAHNCFCSQLAPLPPPLGVNLDFSLLGDYRWGHRLQVHLGRWSGISLYKICSVFFPSNSSKCRTDWDMCMIHIMESKLKRTVLLCIGNRKAAWVRLCSGPLSAAFFFSH